MESVFDPTRLVCECRDMGNSRYADRDYQRAEEAFTLGLTIFEMYGGVNDIAGFGCLMGLADCMRATARHAEAERLIHDSRAKRVRKIA